MKTAAGSHPPPVDPAGAGSSERIDVLHRARQALRLLEMHLQGR